MFGFYGPGSGEEGLGVRVYGSGQHCDSTELSKVCIFIYIYIYIFFFFLGGGGGLYSLVLPTQQQFSRDHAQSWELRTMLELLLLI